MTKYDQKALRALGSESARDALSLIEWSGEGENALDLSMDTYDFMPMALMRAGLAMKREGKGKKEILSALAALAAGYETYALCNFLDGFEDIKCRVERVLALSDKEILVAKSGDKTVHFDLYRTFERTASDCFVFAAEGLAVEMNAARDVIAAEFLDKLITE